MKLVLFTRSLNAGGTERQMAMLALGLAGRGHDVAVVLLYGGGALEELLRGSAVRVLAVGKRGRWDVAGPLCRLRRIFRHPLEPHGHLRRAGAHLRRRPARIGHCPCIPLEHPDSHRGDHYQRCKWPL